MTKRSAQEGSRVVSVVCDAGYSRYEGFLDLTNLNSDKTDRAKVKPVVSTDPTSPAGAPAPPPVPDAQSAIEKCDPHRQYANAKLAQISFAAGNHCLFVTSQV